MWIFKIQNIVLYYILKMTESSVNQIKTKVKVVFLGEQATGKTSIITRFMTNKFQEGIGPTVGIDFLAKSLTIGNTVVRLQLWDTAGQERFRSLIPNYLKDAAVAILVFDLSNRRSFESLGEWIELYNEHRKENSIFFLVGNKNDLTNREVTFEEASKRAEQLGLEYFEASAKTAHNIQNIFQHAGQLIVKSSEPASSIISVRNQNPTTNPTTKQKPVKIEEQPIQKSFPNSPQKKEKNLKLGQQTSPTKSNKKKKGCC